MKTPPPPEPDALIEIRERKCSRCETTRPIEMFYTSLEAKRAKREGRKRFLAPCRVCQREINGERMRPRREYADAIKAERGCADCGLRLPAHPEVFDFDHLDHTAKVATIATFMTKGTFEELVAEIAKCEVVCANCHRIRTRKRGSTYFGTSR